MKDKEGLSTDSSDRLGTFFRRLKWIFFKSGMTSLAFEHFLAMVPATILVPILVNNTLGASVIDVSLTLFSGGLGTIVFTIVSRGKIPAYVSSSFAYIGLTVYLIQERCADGVSPSLAYVYVGWAYLFSGLLLMALSLLYYKKGIERLLSFLLPASIVGPAISLIGLELADTAVVDSGFDVAEGMVDSNAALVSIATLIVIVLFSLIRHKIWKNSAIIIGMICGYLVYIVLNGFPNINWGGMNFFSVPNFNVPIFTIPPNLLSLFIAVLPATFIVFTENIGRVTVISRMSNDADTSTGLFSKGTIKKFQKALFSHGLAVVSSAMIGSVPNTIYAENIAVMGIHKDRGRRTDPDPLIQKILEPYSATPYIIAALLAILFSFVGVLQTVLLGIPKPVIGGMELFLFGIISAPGIQLLVEQRVNYKKVSNQILTAAVLISGVSGLSVDLGLVELKGMSLGFVVGVVLNLLIQFLKWIGNTSDTIAFDEILGACLSSVNKNSKLSVLSPEFEGMSVDLSKPENLSEILSSNDSFHHSSGIDIDEIMSKIAKQKHLHLGYPDLDKPLIIIKETANDVVIDVSVSTLSQDTIKKYLNDYEDSFDSDDEYLHIYVSRSVPMRKVRALIKMASAPKTAE